MTTKTSAVHIPVVVDSRSAEAGMKRLQAKMDLMNKAGAVGGRIGASTLGGAAGKLGALGGIGGGVGTAAMGALGSAAVLAAPFMIADKLLTSNGREREPREGGYRRIRQLWKVSTRQHGSR